MKRLAFNIVVVSLVLVGTACSGDGGEDSTTSAPSTTVAPVTSLAAADTTAPPTTTAAPTTSVTTTVSGVPVVLPEYTIVSRESGDGGDTVVILLDTESYDVVTDIDLANVLADAVDRFPVILTAYVVDDASAADAVISTSPTEDELELLSRHYLVRLEEGFRMVFAGPFSDSPVAILGS